MKQKTIQSIQDLVLIASLAATTLFAANPSGFSGSISVRTSNTISSQKAQSGDAWVGSLNNDVIREGKDLLRKGTPVTGILESTKETTGAPILRLRLTAIGAETVQAEPYEAIATPGDRKLGRKMTGWAITGALVGVTLGGGKGAAVGAAAGAGVGGMRGLSREKGEAVVPSESVLSFRVQ